MPQHLCCPVDAYMLLERGGRLLMLGRATDASHAASLLCPPSGHVEPGEDVASAAIREAAEETGVQLRPSEVRCAVAVHHRSPAGEARFGWFFTADPGWGVSQSTANRQAFRTGMGRRPGIWWRTRGQGCRPGVPGRSSPFHWQQPGSPVHYAPGWEDELTLLPSASPAVADVPLGTSRSL